MTQTLAWARQNWQIALAMAGTGALFLVYFLAYARLERPREGTLEWIARYDRPAMRLAGAGFPVTGGDLFPLVLAVLLTAMSWGIQIGASLFPLGLETLAPQRLLSVCVNYLALPSAAVGVFFLLVKRMFGHTGVAFLSALILGLDVTWQPAVLFFLVLSTYFAYGHLSLAEDCSFGEMAGSLLLTQSAVQTACYFAPCVLLYGAFLLLSLLAGFILRFRSGARTGSGGCFVKLLVIALVWGWVLECLLYLPAALVQGAPFPALLLQPAFYRMVLGRLGVLVRSAVSLSPEVLLTSLFYDWTLFFGGTLAVIAMVAAAICRRKAQGLVIGLWYLGFFALCVLGGGVALPAIYLLALAGVWTGLLNRGCPAMGYLCPAVLLIFTAVSALYF